jgi:protease-4
MAKRGEKRINIGLIILIAVAVFIVLAVVSCSVLIFSGEPMPSGNVALIEIKGTITVEGISGLGWKGASSEEIVKYIEKADEKNSIKAILLDINSGGGSAVASQEIADAIRNAKKPSYAVIREIGTSGAYWIASACDTVICHEMSITGSIGAVASYLEFSGLLEHYNISYQRLVSGPYKDIGSPYKELTVNERAILEKMLAEVHEYFVADVARNRNLSVDKVSGIATGEFFLGKDAYGLGLVDVLGGMKEAESLMKEELNLAEIDFAEYKKPGSLLDILMGAFSEQFFYIGRGIGDSLVNSRIANRIDIIT